MTISFVLTFVLLLFAMSGLVVPVFAISHTTGGFVATVDGDIDVEPEPIDDGGFNIAPDSFLYGLDVALDRLALFLASSDSEKAKIGLAIASERIREVKLMIEQNKFEHAETARAEHANFLADAERSIEKIEGHVTAEDNLQKKIDIRVRLQNHLDLIDQLDKEFTTRIRVLGDVDTTQINFVKLIIRNADVDAKRIKVKIDADEDRARMILREETGKTEFQITRISDEFERIVMMKVRGTIVDLDRDSITNPIVRKFSEDGKDFAEFKDGTIKDITPTNPFIEFITDVSSGSSGDGSDNSGSGSDG